MRYTERIAFFRLARVVSIRVLVKRHLKFRFSRQSFVSQNIASILSCYYLPVSGIVPDEPKVNK